MSCTGNFARQTGALVGLDIPVIPVEHQYIVGRATSGGYGWRVGKSLALAMVRPELAIPGGAFEIAILGTRHKATIVEDSPFDPENLVLRG